MRSDHANLAKPLPGQRSCTPRTAGPGGARRPPGPWARARRQATSSPHTTLEVARFALTHRRPDAWRGKVSRYIARKQCATNEARGVRSAAHDIAPSEFTDSRSKFEIARGVRKRHADRCSGRHACVII